MEEKSKQIKATHKQHIGIYEGVFDKEYCNSLINHFDTETTTKYWQRTKEDRPNFVTQDTILSLPKDDKLLTPFNNILLQAILPLYLKKYIIPIGPESFDLEEANNIQRTFPSEGYHMWHCENNMKKDSITRMLAYTLYLNDVEEGGETEFLYQSLRVKPITGTLCIFPTYFTHSHRGNPPLSGKKYILTGWITPNESHLNGFTTK